MHLLALLLVTWASTCDAEHPAARGQIQTVALTSQFAGKQPLTGRAVLIA